MFTSAQVCTNLNHVIYFLSTNCEGESIGLSQAFNLTLIINICKWINTFLTSSYTNNIFLQV